MPDRILIVDDDAVMSKALMGMVKFHLPAVIVDTCESAAAALERIADTDYDAIVSDLKMPGMDGLQLIRWLRQSRPSCSILLVTGRADRELQLCRFGRLTGFECMQKPLDVDQFGETVQRLTSSAYHEVENTMAG